MNKDINYDLLRSILQELMVARHQLIDLQEKHYALLLAITDNPDLIKRLRQKDAKQHEGWDDRVAKVIEEHIQTHFT